MYRRQGEYYRRLTSIRTEGDWEGWIAFFLEGVAEAAGEAERGIIDAASLITADCKRLPAPPKAGPASETLSTLHTTGHSLVAQVAAAVAPLYDYRSRSRSIVTR